MSIHPLRAAREAHSLSMRQLAEKAGLGKYGHRRIYGWEHGESIPTLLYANALAPHLGFKSGEEVRQACLMWKTQSSNGVARTVPESSSPADRDCGKP